ncbi:BOW99_gp33 family protein [Streptococcus suis]|uniref:BOW99_gp33 family protein n=1 Tax=Streptococcus suis TaxID=1307 RepID=UPI0030104716
MSRKKGQWTPKVTSLRKVIVDGEEQWVEFDPATYVIPAGHPYYDIIVGMRKHELRKGA